MNFVLGITAKVEQIQNRAFLRRVNQTEKVFLYTTRLSFSNGQTNEKKRVWILVRAAGIAEAELLAENRLQAILQDFDDASREKVEQKRLKPRELIESTLNDESEGILRLLQAMRRESSRFITSVEPIATG